MLREMFEEHYTQLVAAWQAHQDLRRREVALVDLASSRARLDELRDKTNGIRRAFAPDAIEAKDAAMTTYCPSFGESVFLFAVDADWRGDEPRFTCICGTLIDGEDEPVSV